MAVTPAQLTKEAGILEERAQQAQHTAAQSVERGAGVASVAQVFAPSLERLAHAELAKLDLADRRALVAKCEQFLVAAARKYDQQAAELRGKASACIEQATSLRAMAKPAPKAAAKRAAKKAPAKRAKANGSARA